MISCDAVSWSVSGRTIISNVTTQVRPGLTAIVGPNGSGKTSLLHVIAGLRRASSGTVRVDGRPLDAMKPKHRARTIALVEQHPATDLDLCALDVINLGRIPHIGAWPGARDPNPDAIEQAIATAGVGHVLNQRWQTLSGGERQRVQLARALAQEPRVLLLDEPTNHLDLAHQIEFIDTVAKLDQTTIAVLHDLDLTAAYADSIIVMREGRVVAQGPTGDVLNAALIREVFDVDVRVVVTERLRVLWNKP